MPFAAICTDLGVPRDTVAGWLLPHARQDRSQPDLRCPFCTQPARPVDDPARHASLLGMYLGDGHLLPTRSLPGVIAEVEAAVLACGARRVGHQRRECRDAVRSGWTHWPCLLP